MKNLIQLICMAFLAAVISPASAQNIFPDSGFVVWYHNTGTSAGHQFSDGHASIWVRNLNYLQWTWGSGLGKVLTSNLDGDYNTAIGWSLF